MERVISVLLIDDHPLLLQGIKSHLENAGNIHIVGEARDADQALEQVGRTGPDLAVIDINLAGSSMNGLELAKALADRSPDTKVVVFTMHEEEEYVLEAIRNGASGYLLKDEPVEEILEAIAEVSSGGSYFSSRISKQMMRAMAEGLQPENQCPLTRRELEVLGWIAEGLINKEIADKLGLSVRTIESYRERIMNKLDIHSVAGLTKYAIREGVISL